MRRYLFRFSRQKKERKSHFLRLFYTRIFVNKVNRCTSRIRSSQTHLMSNVSKLTSKLGSGARSARTRDISRNYSYLSQTRFADLRITMLREQVQKQKRGGRADARFVADTDIRSRVERWNKMEAIR